MSSLSFGLHGRLSSGRLNLHRVMTVFAIVEALKSREMSRDSSPVLGVLAFWYKAASKISVRDLAALLAPCQLPVATGEAAYDCPSITPVLTRGTRRRQGSKHGHFIEHCLDVQQRSCPSDWRHWKIRTTPAPSPSRPQGRANKQQLRGRL